MVPWEPGVDVSWEQGWGGHRGLWCHPLQLECQSPWHLSPAWHLGEDKPPASGRGAQRHSQGLRAELLLSGFLSEQEM